MNALALLAIVAVAHLGPDIAVFVAGGAHVAWETVCYGLEATILWLYAMTRTGGRMTRGEFAVAAYAVFESIQRPACRSMLPMDKPAGLKQGEYMCDVATGFPVSMLSPILLCAVIWVVVQDFTRPSKVCSSNSQGDGAS